VLPVANAKAYNSLWQFKADAWSALEDAAVQLSVASAGERSLERAVETSTELLDVLEPIERLYAYPGTQEFSEVRRMFAAGKYDQFAAMVGEINRTFVTDSFRTGQARSPGRVDQASDRDTHPGEQTSGNRALELHLSILDGLEARYRTPFFSALRSYSHRPTGVFHALPISRGKSIVNSHWIRDMVDFYGLNIFMAETSATCGGLDSLLEPTGPLREARQLASHTFGSRQTYVVTNGTSTAWSSAGCCGRGRRCAGCRAHRH